MEAIVMWVYLGIGLFALFLALLSFVVGEVTDFLHDVTSPVTDFVGEHFLSDHDHELGFSKFVNTGAVLGFLAGFGFIAAFAMAQYGVSSSLAALWGILGGVILGGILGGIWITLSRAEGTLSYGKHELVGMEGVVTERIFPGGQGQVICVVKGMKVWHIARAEKGDELEVGTPVKVTRVVGDFLYVVPLLRSSNQKQ